MDQRKVNIFLDKMEMTLNNIKRSREINDTLFSLLGEPKGRYIVLSEDLYTRVLGLWQELETINNWITYPENTFTRLHWLGSVVINEKELDELYTKSLQPR